jgi:glycosyltransferase involved in cell wall biosynthesis
MRIVIDARYLSRGYSGIGVYTQSLLEALARLDHANEYVCIVRSDYDRTLNVGDNFRIERHPSQPLSLATLLSFHKAVRRHHADVFHATFPILPVWHKGPTVATVHDLQPLLMPEWTGGRPWPVKKAYDAFYSWAYPRTFRRANALLADSRATYDALVARFPETAGKTRVVLPGLPPEAHRKEADTLVSALREAHRFHRRYILYIGSTRPNKNLPNMLRSFARTREQNMELADVDFVLVLSPGRFLPEVQRIVETEGLTAAVRILPPVTEEEKRALYRGAELLFFATRFEGFGIPVLEAQAQGTAVIAGDDASLPEVAGGSAMLVDPLDVDVMARGLERLLSDRHLRMKLVEQGYENIGRFSWDGAAREVLEVYEDLAR